MTADMHRHAAYHNKHWCRVFKKMLTSMTLNNLNYKIGF